MGRIYDRSCNVHILNPFMFVLIHVIFNQISLKFDLLKILRVWNNTKNFVIDVKNGLKFSAHRSESNIAFNNRRSISYVNI